jgi:hypothetical protein
MTDLLANFTSPKVPRQPDEVVRAHGSVEEGPGGLDVVHHVLELGGGVVDVA